MKKIWLKKKLQFYVEKIFGFRIFVYPRKMHGHQDFADIRDTGWNIRTIFDVGAHIGQSAVKFAVAFPAAAIFSFEPVQSTYQQLVANTANAKIHAFNIAMGDRQEYRKIFLKSNTGTNSLVNAEGSFEIQTVAVETIDGFAQEKNIARIDLLKIDVEGYDFEVLKGSAGMLKNGTIVFILVEAGFTPDDIRHVYFGELREYLNRFKYSILGIYDQTLEWSGEQRLRYANVLFAHQPTINQTRY